MVSGSHQHQLKSLVKGRPAGVKSEAARRTEKTEKKKRKKEKKKRRKRKKMVMVMMMMKKKGGRDGWDGWDGRYRTATTNEIDLRTSVESSFSSINVRVQ